VGAFGGGGEGGMGEGMGEGMGGELTYGRGRGWGRCGSGGVA